MLFETLAQAFMVAHKISVEENVPYLFPGRRSPVPSSRIKGVKAPAQMSDLKV